MSIVNICIDILLLNFARCWKGALDLELPQSRWGGGLCDLVSVDRNVLGIELLGSDVVMATDVALVVMMILIDVVVGVDF